MIERFEPTDAHDRRLVPGLGGLLGTFNAAGVLTAADVHTAVRLGELVGGCDSGSPWRCARPGTARSAST